MRDSWILGENKRQNRINTWVYTAGVFDILHYGHIRFLKTAKSFGDILVVGLISDYGTKLYKGKLPLMSYLERAEVLESIRYVDYVVKQDVTDPTRTLKMLKDIRNWDFDILVRADDYKGAVPGSFFIKNNGGKVERVPYCNSISTSSIKRRLLRVDRIAY